MKVYLIECERRDFDGTVAHYFLDNTGQCVEPEDVPSLAKSKFYTSSSDMQSQIYDFENRNMLDQMRHTPGIVPMVSFSSCEFNI